MSDGRMQSDSPSTYVTSLADIYRDLGLPPPRGKELAPSELPEEYRRLLVHARGMTRTLEEAYNDNLGLRVLKSVLGEGVLTRQIVLALSHTDTPVAMALIHIYLQAFPQRAREMIIEQATPLGTILRLQSVDHYYKSHTYFSLTADSAALHYAAFGETNPLYGRRVTISSLTGHVLADAVEIALPIACSKQHAEYSQSAAQVRDGQAPI